MAALLRHAPQNRRHPHFLVVNSLSLLINPHHPMNRLRPVVSVPGKIAAFFLIGTLLTSSVISAKTVANWRFEEGPAGNPVSVTIADPSIGKDAVLDISGNGNHLQTNNMIQPRDTFPTFPTAPSPRQVMQTLGPSPSPPVAISTQMPNRSMPRNSTNGRLKPPSSRIESISGRSFSAKTVARLEKCRHSSF